MKRIICLVLFLALILTGCGSSTQPVESNISQPNSQIEEKNEKNKTESISEVGILMPLPANLKLGMSLDVALDCVDHQVIDEYETEDGNYIVHCDMFPWCRPDGFDEKKTTYELSESDFIELGFTKTSSGYILVGVMYDELCKVDSSVYEDLVDEFVVKCIMLSKNYNVVDGAYQWEFVDNSLKMIYRVYPALHPSFEDDFQTEEEDYMTFRIEALLYPA